MSEEKSPAFKIIIAVAIIIVVGIFIANSDGKVERANSEEDNNSTNNNEPIPPQKPTKPKELAFIKEGLVFHCDFNGNAGDKSGNDNNGTVNGSTFTTDRHGEPDKAANFDGKSWIEVPGLNLDRHSLTFSAWFKTSDKRYVTSMVSQPGGSTTTGTRIGLLTSKACFATGAGNGPTLLSSKGVNDGVWHQLVGAFDKGQLHLYVDGELQGFAKFEPGPHFPDESVYIGKEFRLPTTGNDYRYYTGSLDDVRIYDHALSEKQVKALYDLEKPKGK